jgi:protein tyrosine phosphatase
VKLAEIEGVVGSDFISANWISGEIPGSEKAYIATQGPLQHTVEDFWRMVLDHNVKVVVMLSNLMENGRVINSNNIW